MEEIGMQVRVALGRRLREERLRVGLSQQSLGEACGVRKQAQLKYESGESTPSADYLATLADVGIDAGYVLTGRASAALAADEAELLRRYRAASAEVRAVVIAALGATAVSSGSSPRTVVHGGEQGQVFGGDQVNHQPVTFNVGGKKRGKRE
jgi:transcriptional regulator with XRE-family HTH domain